MSALVKNLTLSQSVATADEIAALTSSLTSLRESFQALVGVVGDLAERVEQIVTMPVDVKKNAAVYTVDIVDDGSAPASFVIDRKETSSSSDSSSSGE